MSHRTNLDALVDKLLKPIPKKPIHEPNTSIPTAKATLQRHCKICKKPFDSYDNLATHLLSHLKGQSNDPEPCSPKKTKENLLDFKSKEHDTKLKSKHKVYSCRMCDKHYMRTESYVDHMFKVHGSLRYRQDVSRKKLNENAPKVPIVKLERIPTTVRSNCNIKTLGIFKENSVSSNKNKLDKIGRNIVNTDISGSLSKEMDRMKKHLSHYAETETLKEDLTKLYQCDNCKLFYVEFDHIKKHSKKCPGYEFSKNCSEKCNKCNISFFYKELQKHNQHHLNNINEFEFITVINSKRSTYNKEIKSKSETVVHNLNSDSNFVTKRDCDRHINCEQHDSFKIMCDICDRYFNENYIENHLLEHATSSPRETNEKLQKPRNKQNVTKAKHQEMQVGINNSLNSKSPINKHVRRHSETTKVNTKNNTTMKKTLPCRSTKKFLYKCTKCNLHFISLAGLRCHVFKNDHTIKGYDCKICKFRFSNLSLLSHTNIHHRDLKLQRKNFVVRDDTLYRKIWHKKYKENDISGDDEQYLEHIKDHGNMDVNTEKEYNEIIEYDVHTSKRLKELQDTINSQETSMKRCNNQEIDHANSNKKQFDFIHRMALEIIPKYVLYICEDCNVCFFLAFELKEHFNKHEKICILLVQMCKYCGYYFFNNEMAMHVIEHHKENCTVSIEIYSPKLKALAYKTTKLFKKINSPPDNFDINTKSLCENVPSIPEITTAIRPGTCIIEEIRNVSKTPEIRRKGSCLGRCKSCNNIVIAKINSDKDMVDITCSTCKEIDIPCHANDTQITGLNENIYETLNRANSRNILTKAVENVSCNVTKDNINNKKDVGTNTDSESNIDKTLVATPNETTYKIQLKAGEVMRNTVEIDTGNGKIKIEFTPYKNITNDSDNLLTILSDVDNTISETISKETSIDNGKKTGETNKKVKNSKDTKTQEDTRIMNKPFDDDKTTVINITKKSPNTMADSIIIYDSDDENNSVMQNCPCIQLSDDEDDITNNRLTNQEKEVLNIESNITATPIKIEDSASMSNETIMPKVEKESVVNNRKATVEPVNSTVSSTNNNALVDRVVNSPKTNNEIGPQTEKRVDSTIIAKNIMKCSTNKQIKKTSNDKNETENSNNTITIKYSSLRNRCRGNNIIKQEEMEDLANCSETRTLLGSEAIKSEELVEANVVLKLESVTEHDSEETEIEAHE